MIPQTMPAHNGQQHPLALLPTHPAPFPEAPCSTNCYVDFSPLGGGRHQITARGNTPAEMAANYRGAVQALEAMYGVEQNETRGDALLPILLDALSKALCRQDMGLAVRLVNAAKLVQAGAVSGPDTFTGAWQVRSQAEPQHTVYTVTGRTCDCADARKHAGEEHYCCKHVAACVLTMRLKG